MALSFGILLSAIVLMSEIAWKRKASATQPKLFYDKKELVFKIQFKLKKKINNLRHEDITFLYQSIQMDSQFT